LKVQTAKRIALLRDWAAQINDRIESGQSVKQWCERQGINRKTYYYRVKVLQEEMLELIETRGMNWASGTNEIAPSTIGASRLQTRRSSKNTSIVPQIVNPEFAEIQMPPSKSPALTVRVGGYAVDIQNHADDKLVGHVLRLVAQL
jgi:hypothetical protein